MKPGYGSRKGSAFERKLSKELSLWWSDDKRNDLFWRTHSSGQLGTVSKKRMEYGDIMSIDDESKPFMNKFHIEARHGLCIRVQDLIYKPKPSSSNMTGFIDEGVLGARDSNRHPIWFFREQGKPIMTLMQYEDFCFWIPKSAAENIVIALFPGYELILFSFEDFKKHFDKGRIGGFD